MQIIEDAREFTGSIPQNDDISLIAIRKTSKKFLSLNKASKRNNRHRQVRSLHLPHPGPMTMQCNTKHKIQRLVCRPISTGFGTSRPGARPTSRITRNVLLAKRKRRSNMPTSLCWSVWSESSTILNLALQQQKSSVRTLRFIPEWFSCKNNSAICWPKMDCNRSRPREKHSIRTCTKQLRMNPAMNIPKRLWCAKPVAVIDLRTGCCDLRKWLFPAALQSSWLLARFY